MNIHSIQESWKVCYSRSIFNDELAVPAALLSQLALERLDRVLVYNPHIILDSVFEFYNRVVNLSDPANWTSI
jgi:hypothetical protein